MESSLESKLQIILVQTGLRNAAGVTLRQVKACKQAADGNLQSGAAAENPERASPQGQRESLDWSFPNRGSGGGLEDLQLQVFTSQRYTRGNVIFPKSCYVLLSIILTPGPNFCLLKDCRRKPGVTTSRTSSYLPHTYLEGSQRMLLSVYACGSVIFDFFPRGVTEGGWTKRKKPQHFKPTKKLRSFWLVFGHRHCRGPVPTFWYLLEE
ncbi:hypothetical protein Y1Q_0021720 [Alligator mississippiensis]|uniref:Uncharacterized protein n=1 Tax=Alligator mississippiensis TaxID=8496 RepID=A0A151PB75_ALLMI|nr:hypothetical protein Y1Q_0021720 [Alligator mississippiensis]